MVFYKPFVLWDFFVGVTGLNYYELILLNTMLAKVGI